MSGSVDVIDWTREKLESLKKKSSEYMNDDDEFTFEGHVIIKSYARYLIEYLETVL